MRISENPKSAQKVKSDPVNSQAVALQKTRRGMINMQSNSTAVKIMTMAAAAGVLPPEVIYCINEKEDTLEQNQ